jgi:hypothetical protein
MQRRPGLLEERPEIIPKIYILNIFPTFLKGTFYQGNCALGERK